MQPRLSGSNNTMSFFLVRLSIVCPFRQSRGSDINRARMLQRPKLTCRFLTRGFFSPVESLFLTSRVTRAASSLRCS